MSETIKPLKTFYQDVDKRSKKEMIAFLENHFRYDTMSSWNRSTSYANKVKVWDVIPSSLQDKVFEMMDVEGFYDDINWILEVWGSENDYAYQAGFNGRSGGYIVMYEGSYKNEYFIKPDEKFNHPSGTYSDRLRRWVQKEEAEKNGWIGKTYKKISTWPGRSIDQGEDFLDWEMGQLKSRVELVQSFDTMCDNVVAQVIDMAQNQEVVEETIMVPKIIKSIQ
jgi:hypothetical protein